MTTVQSASRTAESATAVVDEFFTRYRAQDVDGMTDVCSMNADFSYVPFEMWGKQRVLRGDGKVRTIGKPIAFPNLTNTVHTTTANDDGDVIVEVDIEGTQQLAWGFITPAGKHYSEPHLFVFHVDQDGLIDDITAYWNNAGICTQLGHNEVD
jgi:ketosteroid isomerase-like protein